MRKSGGSALDPAEDLRLLAQGERTCFVYKIFPCVFLCRLPTGLQKSYAYGKNIHHTANPFPPFLEQMRRWVSNAVGEEKNQLTLTFYEPGAGMWRHGDNETSLVPGSKIAAY